MALSRYQIRVQNGPDVGRIYKLDTLTITLGRDPLADITLNDPEISRQHARLIQTSDSYQIQDMGSTNGTFVDGYRLGSDPIDLIPGQVIALGEAVTLIYERSSIVTESTPPDESGAKTVALGSLSMADLQPDPEPEPEPEPAVEPPPPPPAPDPKSVSQDDLATMLDMERDQIDAELAARADLITEPDLEPVEDDNSAEIPPLPSISQPPPEPQAPYDYQASQPKPAAVPPPPPASAPVTDMPEDKKRSNRLPLILTAVTLLLLCCCCGLVAFMWFYGGDIILRELGMLP